MSELQSAEAKKRFENTIDHVATAGESHGQNVGKFCHKILTGTIIITVTVTYGAFQYLMSFINGFRTANS